MRDLTGEIRDGKTEERIVKSRFNDTRIYINGQVNLAEGTARAYRGSDIDGIVRTFSGDVRGYVEIQEEGLTDIGRKTYLMGVSGFLEKVSLRKSLAEQRLELLKLEITTLSDEYFEQASSIDLR